MSGINRRQLLQSVLVTGLCATSSVRSAAARQPLLKLSCQPVHLQLAPNEGGDDSSQVIDYCAELGFEAVDPTGIYFPGYPKPPAVEDVNQIKRQAFLQGLGISRTGVRNNFAVADAAKRKADVEHIKQWIEVAAQLGAPVLEAA